MDILSFIVLFTIFGSVASLVGGILLLTKEKLTKKYSIYFVGFAAGALLGTVFLEMLPEMAPSGLFTMPLLGILSFFILENFLRWHHHHGGKEVHTFNYMITIGDTIHNFVDGIAIAASFLTDVRLGVATSVAVFFHEIPQEIGDFAVLLRGGWSRLRVIGYNIMSALASIIGAVATYFFLTASPGLTVNLVSFTAGVFIYIAGADLIPEIRHERQKRGMMLMFTVAFVLGVGVMYVMKMVFPGG